MLQSATWMTVEEVASELGVNTSRVRQLIRAGKLSASKHGTSWAVDRRELLRFSKLERKPGNPNFLKKSC